LGVNSAPATPPTTPKGMSKTLQSGHHPFDNNPVGPAQNPGGRGAGPLRRRQADEDLSRHQRKAMRNRLSHLRPILDYLGALYWIFSLVMLVPLVVGLSAGSGGPGVWPWCFVIPSALGMLLGILLKRRVGLQPLSGRASMLVCVLGWITVSVLGALPFWLGLGMRFLDAYFETVSGFTTTGITLLTGLDQLPPSIIFWRSFIQWLGGLGILTFFLVVYFSAGPAHRLFSAESHKVFSKRLAPGLFSTLKMLWAMYAAFTALIAVLLSLEGMSSFDAINHALTSLATGGFSPHDASIGYFEQQGYRHFVLIEYTVVLGMLLGGTSFLVHYRLLTGNVRSLWDNLEMRLWWTLVTGATVLVAGEHYLRVTQEGLSDTFRHSLFQVVSIVTTTGFATRDIRSPYFAALSKQVFLILMVVGGCVGSTSGGIKVLRIGVLFKMVDRQVRRVIHGPSATTLVVVDSQVVPTEELRRIAAVFFAWIVLLAVGSGVTAALSNLGPLESASGMFSALGNIGPCYISVQQMTQLHPVVKVTYILGMLAGRLEILPILLLFSRKAWS